MLEVVVVREGILHEGEGAEQEEGGEDDEEADDGGYVDVGLGFKGGFWVNVMFFVGVTCFSHEGGHLFVYVEEE